MKLTTIIVVLLLITVPGLPVTHAFNANETLKGEVIDAGSSEPIPGASVYIEELERGVATDENGRFEFSNVPAGTFTLVVRSVGFSQKTIHTIHPTRGILVIDLEAVVFTSDDIIVTNSPIGRNIQYQPVQALNSRQLQKKAAPSLGEILDGSPGVAMRSFGSAPARPVIRGMDGDRILVLQNGERMGDLSSTAHDHAVALDPLAIERLEVVRGPASLLYGSNAIGGVVNLFSYDLPQDWEPGVQGSLISHGATVNRQAAGLARAQYRTNKMALSGSFTIRDAGNLRTPDGLLPSTFMNSYSFGTGFGYRSNKLQTGAAFTGMDYTYGLPESLDDPDESVEIRMKRFQLQTLTTIVLERLFRKAELRLSANEYRHDEFAIERSSDGSVNEGLDLGFDQKSISSSLAFIHNPVSRFEGAIGISGQYRNMRIGGEEILTPNANSFFLAGYVYEEMNLTNGFSLQRGVRVELQQMMLQRNDRFNDTSGLKDRTDLIFSGSFGVNYRPNNYWEFGLQVARAFRSPTLEELYSNAPHIGAGAYEIGDPALGNETSIGTDIFITYRSDDVRLELSGYLNRVGNFIKYSPTGQMHEPSGLPVFTYDAADATLYGFEFAAEKKLTEYLKAGLAIDYVIGNERDNNRMPLPFIPPLRTYFTINYDSDNWWTGSRLRWVSAQNRVAPEEQETPGYALLGLDTGFRISDGLSIALRLDNLLNVSYRDHLSRIEERNNSMPGRNLNAMLRWDF